MIHGQAFADAWTFGGPLFAKVPASASLVVLAAARYE